VHHMTTTVTAAGMGDGGKGRSSARVSAAGQEAGPAGAMDLDPMRRSTSGGGGKEGCQGAKARSSRGGAHGAGGVPAAAATAEGHTVQGARGKHRSQSAGKGCMPVTGLFQACRLASGVEAPTCTCILIHQYTIAIMPSQGNQVTTAA
jgi:hypothetical protein